MASRHLKVKVYDLGIGLGTHGLGHEGSGLGLSLRSALRAALTIFSITVKIMQENKVLLVIIIN